MVGTTAGRHLRDRLFRRGVRQGSRRGLGVEQGGVAGVGVLCMGRKEALGLWIEQTEGVRFWCAVMNELKAHGCRTCWSRWRTA